MKHIVRLFAAAAVILLMLGITTIAAATANASAVSCSASTPLASRPTLRVGSSGTCVRELQARLVAHKQVIGVDGAFGPATLAAVKRFQGANGLVADGIVEQKTWSKLLGKSVATLTAPLAPPVSTSYSKYTCGNAGSKVLLVFDDFPKSSAGWKALIDAAKANNIGIGVAPNGMYVQSGRANVSYARQKGMLVVDHTYDHKQLTKLSTSSIVWEITRPYINSNYVRPPYGAENSTVRAILAQQHKYDCLWNLDPEDWNGKSPLSAANYIIAHATRGSTAVVHLNHLGSQPSLLAYIKSGLARRGIQMCTPWTKPTTNNMPAVYCK